MTDLVLENAMIVDVGAERILPAQNIEITGVVITGVHGRESPQDARRVVDCSDRYVMSGLADMHVHIETLSEARLFAANGVTTVRHMDGSPLHLAMEKAFSGDAYVAPTVVSTSPIIDGLGPQGFPGVPHAVVAPSPADAPTFVEDLAARGYRQLKVYDNLTAQQHRALCAAARQRHILVTGHCPRSLTFEQAIAHGQTCFEHLTGITKGRLRPSSSGHAPGAGAARIVDAARRIDDEAVARLAVMMRERGIWICPTTTVLTPPISIAQAVAPPTVGSPPAPSDHLSLAFRQRWKQPRTVLVGGVQLGWQEYSDALDVWNSALLRCLSILIAEGVAVLVGTDFPAPGTVAGFATHDELERLGRLTPTPWAALRAATSDAARFLGEEDKVGAVAPGQRADLVILRADPARDMSTLRTPFGVVLRGRYLSRPRLDRILADQIRDVSSPGDQPGHLEARAVSGDEVAGSMEHLWGEHVHERGTFRHRRVGSGLAVTERWVTVGQTRARMVELFLGPDGIIEHGRFTATWGFAHSCSVISRTGPRYVVRTDHADGIQDVVHIDGPLAPSERTSWSAFASIVCGGLGGDVSGPRLWDGHDRLCTATADEPTGTVTIRRATEVTRLTLASSPGQVVADCTSQGGQNAYERRLVLRRDATEPGGVAEHHLSMSRKG
jgi:imidazolonepropionase-like amidohydrolase